MFSERVGKGLRNSAAILGIGGFLLVVIPSCEYYSLTGSFWPRSHIESLRGPISVKGWSDDGLLLADGRIVPLPGIRTLPRTSRALSLATKDGVEILPDGQVVGLLKVWHWCGNDPVRDDVRRIPLGPLLCFLREGVPTEPLPGDDVGPHSSSGGFTDHGWSISEYVGFTHFFLPRHPAWKWPMDQQS